MTNITSNITFDNDNGQITKCVLKITGGKTFTVTLVKGGYEVVEGGTDPCSTPGSANAGSNAPGSANAAANAANPANPATTTPGSAPLHPGEKKEYNSQDQLIEYLTNFHYENASAQHPLEEKEGGYNRP